MRSGGGRALLLVAARLACTLAWDSISGTTIQAVRLDLDMPVSPDNPFFENGRPYYVDMPDALCTQLYNAGCTYAWRRITHRDSVLDAKCNNILNPFLHSSPGALLGFLYGVLLNNGSAFINGPVAYNKYGTVVSASLLTDNGEGTGTYKADLSSLNYTRNAPRILDPVPRQPLSYLYDRMHVALHPAPFFEHTAGKWSFELAGGGTSASQAANARAFKWSAELWLYLGHHSKQADLSHPFLVNNDILNIHGLHGAMYGWLKVAMTRNYPKPTVALWDEIHTVCQHAIAVDFALYVSCAHGLGHSMAFYVSSRRATVSQAVAVCAHKAPDSRLVLLCADGFFHELERAALFLDPALHMHFMPAGRRAPCDHNGTHNFVFQCFLHIRNQVMYNREGERPALRALWVENTTLADGRLLFSLTTAGQGVWRDLIAFCAETRLYPTWRQQAACVMAFVPWLEAVMKDGTNGLNDVLFDTRTLLLESSVKAGYMSEAVPAPRVRGESSQTGSLIESDVLSEPAPHVSKADLLYAMCERASANYWTYLPCATQRQPDMYLKMNVDIGLNTGGWIQEYVHSMRYWTAGSTQGAAFTNASWYNEHRARHDADPLVPTNLGVEDIQVDFCNQTWSASRFADGYERQVAFARRFCFERARSHGYNLLMLEEPEQLPTLYAAFDGHLSHAAHAASSSIAARVGVGVDGASVQHSSTLLEMDHGFSQRMGDGGAAGAPRASLPTGVGLYSVLFGATLIGAAAGGALLLSAKRARLRAGGAKLLNGGAKLLLASRGLPAAVDPRYAEICAPGADGTGSSASGGSATGARYGTWGQS
jgi:hypothetical protein